MEIRLDDLQGEAVISLLKEHLDNMHSNTPAESVHALDVSDLREPSVWFWSAWESDQLLGFGGLKHLSEQEAEIKSMRTAAEHLRKGVASKLLLHIIQEAKLKGYKRLNLETGSAADFVAARALYECHEFQYTEPFSGYKLDENSVFMTLDLSN